MLPTDRRRPRRAYRQRCGPYFTNKSRWGEQLFLSLSVPRLTWAVQIRKVIFNLAEQYKTKEQELESFKRDYNIRVVTKA
jgi:hypothetical protein